MNIDENRRKILLTIADNFSRILFANCKLNLNNEEESSDEDEFVACFHLNNSTRGKRYHPPRSQNYIYNIIPQFNSKQFQEHFRMSCDGFEAALLKIGPRLRIQVGEYELGRPCISPRLQLLSVIWLLATPDSFRSVGDRFGMGKSSLWDSFLRVITILEDIAPEVIQWPSENDLATITAKYYRISRNQLKNVVGAIDGSYIPIKAPKENKTSYITRKCNYAITLQAICDCNLRFLDCYTGWPGSVSDSRIFKHSFIYKNIMRNRQKYLPDNHFIVADKAYPTLSWCIPPYIDNGVLTLRETKFNTTISRVRQTIERCFSLLKGRFRRLKYLDMSRTDLVPKTILACCVLHNIILNYGDIHLQNQLVEAGLAAENPVENEDADNELRNNLELGNDHDGTIFRDQLMFNIDIHTL
ncbi:hypothetical protein JTB14_036206 [Gonioctena quinquepunctata]|nr:hypothetical protein JTB14_036206 [Gonioctena quinquepunctata]